MAPSPTNEAVRRKSVPKVGLKRINEEQAVSRPVPSDPLGGGSGVSLSANR